ncbi:hypothetical protein LIAUS_15755 [Leptospira interrogans]
MLTISKNLSQNLKMWELTQKFNNIRITEGSQITKGDGFCRNYCVLLKISKKLFSKFFKVLRQVLSFRKFFSTHSIKIYFK